MYDDDVFYGDLRDNGTSTQHVLDADVSYDDLLDHLAVQLRNQLLVRASSSADPFQVETAIRRTVRVLLSLQDQLLGEQVECHHKAIRGDRAAVDRYAALQATLNRLATLFTSTRENSRELRDNGLQRSLEDTIVDWGARLGVAQRRYLAAVQRAETDPTPEHVYRALVRIRELARLTQNFRDLLIDYTNYRYDDRSAWDKAWTAVHTSLSQERAAGLSEEDGARVRSQVYAELRALQTAIEARMHREDRAQG